MKGKLEPPYKPDSYEVLAKKGSMVTATNGVDTVTLNASFFKHIRKSKEELVAKKERLFNQRKEDEDKEGTPAKEPTS